jgi:hypothetical protein
MEMLEQWARRTSHLNGENLFSGPFENGPVTAGVGVRRVLLGTSVGYRLDTAYGYMEVHTDGATFASSRILTAPPAHLPPPGGNDADERKFTVPALTLSVAGCLRAAASAALEVGCFGDCAVIAELHGERLRLVEHRSDYFEHPVGETAIDGPLSSRHTLTLESLVEMSPNLLIATRQVCADLVQAFGAPELTTITPDGHPLLSAFPSGYHQSLTSWSQATGISLG